MKDYEQTYEDHWKSLVEIEGILDMDAVKRELHDYWTFMQSVSEVYCHVTGSRISKPNTCAKAVIDAADDYYATVHIHTP